MAALTQVASSDAFLEVIAKSGLLSVPAFAQVQASAAKTPDPKQLARDLVKAGTLTTWQANQLLYGRQWLKVGKYKLLDQVSSGDVGRVYLAEHAQMGRRHLLKVLSKRHACDPVAVKRFMSQAQQACSLDHRNISHIYDVNQDTDWHFVVMEHVEGQDLASLVEKEGPLPLPDALEYVRQAVEGLHHAHAAGVVHGDLKPANLLRDASGTIKILEIGQAGLVDAPTNGASVEETGETPELSVVIFRAPEVAAGEVADRASDVYSLGGVLCYLLTGKSAANAAAAAEQLRSTAGIPPELADACVKLMAEQPSERPATVLEAWNLLAEAAAKWVPVVQPSETDSSAGKKPRVAQRLDANEIVEEVSEIVADESLAGDSPFSGLVITPRMKEVKQPAETPGKTQAGQGSKPAPRKRKTIAVAEELVEGYTPDELPSQDLLTAGLPAESPLQETTFQSDVGKATTTPLIIAGVLGGTGALVVALAAVLWILTSRKPETKVAQSPAPKIAPPAVVARSVPPPPRPESNPVVGETNPEANPVAPGAPPPPPPLNADQPPDASPKKKGRRRSSTTSTPAAPTDAPAPMPESGAPDVKTEAPVEPKAADTQPKAEDKPAVNLDENKDAKPEAKPAEKAPEKAPPKAAPKAPPSPFRGFTAAVALPELPEATGQPPGDALAPQSLGPCKLDAKAPLEITLKGGASANRNPKLTFELAPQNAKPREWEFVLNGSDAPLQIATLSAKDDSVVFQWTEKAVEQPQLSRYLSNCVLEFSSGTHQHRSALRLPIEAEPLVLEIDRRGAPLKLRIPDLPSSKFVFVEVPKVEGFKKIRVEPSKPVNPGELITVWTGPDEKSPLLALRIETSVSTSVLSVTHAAHVNVEGSKLMRPFSKKDLTTHAQKTGQEFTIRQNQLKELKEKKPAAPRGMSATDFNKQYDELTKNKLPKDISELQTRIEQLKFLLEFASNKDGDAKVHFRVYHETEDGPIDLLKTYVDAPAKGKK